MVNCSRRAVDRFYCPLNRSSDRQVSLTPHFFPLLSFNLFSSPSFFSVRPIPSFHYCIFQSLVWLPFHSMTRTKWTQPTGKAQSNEPSNIQRLINNLSNLKRYYTLFASQDVILGRALDFDFLDFIKFPYLVNLD